jgi:hypothetical protein
VYRQFIGKRDDSQEAPAKLIHSAPKTIPVVRLKQSRTQAGRLSVGGEELKAADAAMFATANLSGGGFDFRCFRLRVGYSESVRERAPRQVMFDLNVKRNREDRDQRSAIRCPDDFSTHFALVPFLPRSKLQVVARV